MVVVVVVVVSEGTVFMSTTSYELAWEPSMAKNSSPSRARKTGAQLRDNPEVREKCVRAENPVPPPYDCK